MENVGLVLEGGGMKGVYTGGVLDFFMDRELYFPYVIGVSAGACNALSYLSKQRGRNRQVTVDFVRDPRYLSYRNLIRKKSIFGMDFIFREIPEQLVPFDFQTFSDSKQKLVVATTESFSGEPAYFSNDVEEDMILATRASSSLPFVAQPVQLKGMTLFDGGMADPIPIRKSIADGNRKHLVVMTKTKDYVKRPFRHPWFAKRMYPQYPGLVEAMIRRHRIYNETVAYVRELEAQGSAFVIQPSADLKISRVEKDPLKLEKFYELGYCDAERAYDSILSWINQP